MRTFTMVLTTGEHFSGTWTVGYTDPNWFSIDLEGESMFETLVVPKDNVRFIIYEKANAPSTPDPRSDLAAALDEMSRPKKVE